MSDESPLNPEAERAIANVRRLMVIASVTTFLAVATFGALAALCTFRALGALLLAVITVVFLVSSSGIQIVKGRTVVCPSSMST